MSLSIVVPYVDNYALTRAVLAHLKAYRDEADTEIIALDNGSTEEGGFEILREAKVVHLPRNMGAYAVFSLVPYFVSTDIIGILHSDLFVHEPGYDMRILTAFHDYPQLGLAGFVGSNEIDGSGGRGLGTMSNFQGHQIKFEDYSWKGSAAEVHGRRMKGLARAAVVDGCSMIFRRSVLEQIPHRPDYPPHHFYDKLISCQVMELGYEIAVLGVACDHIGGQTAGGESYHTLAREWCQRRGIEESDNGWDYEVYKCAEAQWLAEYRDRKSMIPMTVPESLEKVL